MERDLVRFIAILFCVLVAGPSFALVKKERLLPVSINWCDFKQKAPISVETIAHYHDGPALDLPIPAENLNPKKPQKFRYYTKITSTRWLIQDPGTVNVYGKFEGIYGTVIVELKQIVSVDQKRGTSQQSLACMMHEFS